MKRFCVLMGLVFIAMIFTCNVMAGEKELKSSEDLLTKGDVYFDQANYGEAESCYSQALDIYRKTVGTKDRHLGVALHKLGELYYLQGRFAEAEPFYEEELQILESNNGKTSTENSDVIARLYDVYFVRGKFKEAEGMSGKELEVCAENYERTDPRFLRAKTRLADLYYAQGRYKEAAGIYGEVIETDKMIFGYDHAYLATLYSKLSNTYKKLGVMDEAKKLDEQAGAIREKQKGA